VPVVAVAACPHPPLLVPAVAGGAAEELETLRQACDRAVGRLLCAGTDEVVLVGAGADTGPVPAPLGGSFAPWGVPLRVGDPDAASLPLSLLVGLWLLGRAAAPAPRAVSAWTVAGDEPPAGCARLGRALADRPGRTGLLVMGDGSARRGEKAPGYDDPAAPDFDAAVAAALAGADPAALAALDPALAGRLLAAGRAPWQVLAAAAGGRDWRGDLLFEAAPYGVEYLVAVWEPR
jgi:hypothetical protein